MIVDVLNMHINTYKYGSYDLLNVSGILSWSDAHD